ncbi:uncharacterized protein LOC108209036 isoform X3 [Daucus carota subsp. sativus]|uniref:uncharacterized protein LOC108209036 isoform X3 n=1 Tax=Daucus carota subsp. sativus TaxID=79200 RepID=UPI0007EF69E8|nr:PREDICTED: uncharacterized protein LOC108209036 isoform X1 [Daucus carota subsp. sativus]XP_017235219.1 PREDICTED: uncharacterized protein LOC108209036 isoform X1 [Daucus carota subsp. sativus]XP_017235220.1 PREDICTED: uncharacterized protein LOC108209036 isoform X1 [Daucus carota subsp. sativus]
MKELGAFGLQKGESIKEAQARFQLIVNNLGRLGKIIPQSELNMNILASVPFDFQSNSQSFGMGMRSMASSRKTSGTPKTCSIPVLDSSSDFSGELDEDREELLFAADFAQNASYRACSDSFWKKLECYFAPVTSQNESYLKHQQDLADAIGGSLYQNAEGEDYKAPTLLQRLISAIIDDDESEGMSQNGDKMESPIPSPDCNSHMLSVEDNIRVQLQSIDLCPKMHPEGEDAIDKDIRELEEKLVQQAQKKKQYIAKIYESIQHRKDAEKRNLEQAAMSKLIEMAYKRQRVSYGSHSSKRVLRRVNKQAALPFAERTLARCLEFEDTGRNWFGKAASSSSVAIGSDVARGNEEPHNVGKNPVNPSTKQPTESVSFERRNSASLMDLDEGGMQDHDWHGLAVPMDNLSDVHFDFWF